MKSNNFREQVALMTSWFIEWNECEQTVALYSLLKKSSPVQAIFLDQVLQQSLAECTDVKQLEAKANDEAYILSLQNEEKEVVTHQLLRLLPLLQVGKTAVKKVYLQLIPELLSHTIHKGVNVEESRQLLSYSLIHPAITTEERANFQIWMGSLEDRFTHSGSGHTSGSANHTNLVYHQHQVQHLHCGGSSSSGSSTAASSSVGGSSSNTSNNLSVGSHCHSPSPCSSSHHSLGLNSSPDISASQEYINIITNNLAVPPPSAPASQPPSVAPPPTPSSLSHHHHHHHPPPDHHASSSPIVGSGGAHISWSSQQSQQQQQQNLAPPDGYSGSCEAGAAINPTAPPPSTATSAESSPACCAQAQPFVPSSNGHLTLRAANSHVGAFGAAPGHMPLHATSSAPPNFNSMPPPSGPSQAPAPPQNSHPPLRRTTSITPPVRLQNSDKTVSEWLKSNHGHHLPPHHTINPQQLGQKQQPLQLQLQQQQLHLQQGQHPILSSTRSGQYSDHAPLSPQSSVTSSGSGGSDSQLHLLEDGPQPTRDSFLEPGSGMREVPVWLKSLRLHKYSYLFKQLSYEEMLGITEDMLEQQSVTKGARHKIYVNIVKLRERQNLLRELEKSVVEEGGSIKGALGEMKTMLNTPIKASPSPHHASTSTSSSLPSSPQSPSSSSGDDVQEGDLPAQFCRLMGKIFTQLFTASSRDDNCFQLYLQLIDKCLNHEAFSNQRRLLQSWKQSAQKIWQPPPQKYGDKPRRFGNTFPLGSSLGSRIIPRASRGPVPLTTHGPGQQVPGPGGIQQWSFGSKRSILGSGCGGGHMPVQRNSSLNAPFINKPGLLEQTKQPVSRTHSAPINRPVTLPLQGCDANDTEINARLDSLCISMTEHALGSSDNNDRGPNY
ncbi:protein Smaug homolog 1-like [Elysia marginata]|uniref:Protein Smaug homolog 1-like n=1 Tax=Elysia marginata TaxID=1093978 RepID=A0AAV4JSR3_9GAST|nr:protein Smaug homolog 1-like [Elysia marginata]